MRPHATEPGRGLPRRALLAAALLLTALPGFAAAGDWGRLVVIRLKENRVAGLGATLFFPVNLLQYGLKTAQLTRLHNGVLDLNTGGVDLDLKAAWSQIRHAGNIGPIPFENKGMKYTVAIRADRLVVSVTPRDKPDHTLTLQIALRFIDAALAAGGNKIDLYQLIQATKDYPPGFVFDVRHRDFQIEVVTTELGLGF
ncbi:MAG: hypothetical protein KA419_17065 [Acidobacteria bacterium]|nr:hypothetical protein [Acidobacteriota bacterium]